MPQGESRPNESDDSEPVVDVGVLVAPGPQSDAEQLRDFTEEIVATAESELTAATATTWRFHPVEVDPLPDGRGRRPSVFIDDAMVRIAERPYDVFVVVTDVPLTSHRKRAVPGLPSRISRTVVISTRRLVLGDRAGAPRSLDDPAVRWNGATLLLHLIGHVIGAEHTTEEGIMQPFRFDPERRSVPTFESIDTRNLQRLITEIPDESVSRGRLGQFAFHLRSLARNPGDVIQAVSGSRGVLLPLSLPKL
ncbi:MAG: hypothetical protein ACOCPX_04495, partial [Halapricum sp.]